jgi:16S rRNA (adenine(1408)-N(1))-methyltransferase
METIRGKTSLEVQLNGFTERLAHYNRIVLDLGTGDGRYVRTLAGQHADWFVIGLDSCRENLRERSRTELPNLLFVIARAQSLPQELNGLITHLTINFPWGSLLESLLAGDSRLMRGLNEISRADASIELRLNGGALAEVGTVLEAGTEEICKNLMQFDWRVGAPVWMDAQCLRTVPSTWAKRLAFGRDPRAIAVSANK